MLATEYLSALRDGPYCGSEMAFSMEEYQGRVSKLRTAMREADLDVVLIADPGGMYYFSGYYTFETSVHAVLVVPLDGAVTLQVPPVEVSNILIKGWVDNIRSFDAYRPDGMDHTGEPAVMNQLADILRESGVEGGRIGIDTEQPSIRIEFLWQLQAILPKARIVSVRSMLLDIRGIKSPKEIAYHREAARITSVGMRAGLDAVAEGRTENDVAAEIYAAMVREGSEFNSIQPIVVSGYRSSFNHMHFFRRKIENDEPVMMEIGGVFNRYCSPLFRMKFVGRPPEIFSSLHKAISESLDILADVSRAGTTCHDAVVKASRPLQPYMEEGFWGGFIGYGVGCQFPPSWVERSVRFALNNHQELKPGMVFHTPTGLRFANRFIVAQSETMVVSDSGPAEVLTDCTREL